MLAMGEFSGLSQTEIKEKITKDFNIKMEELDQYRLEIVYMNEEDYEGKAFLFMQHKESQKWYEVQGWHCSCFGFENQFQPDETMLECLLIRKGFVHDVFNDETQDEDDLTIIDHIKKLHIAEAIDKTMRDLQ